MAVYFWVYRERSEGEPEKLSQERAEREYQKLRPWRRGRWPGGLRLLRITPAPGAGLRVWITVNKPNDTIERFSKTACGREVCFSQTRGCV